MDSTLYQVVSAAVAVLVLLVWVRPQSFKFLVDKDSGYPSQSRRGQETAMIVSTWLLVTVTLMKDGDVPEWMYVFYMLAWAGAQAGSIWLKLKGQREAIPGSTTEINKTETTRSTAGPAPAAAPPPPPPAAASR